MIYLLDLFFFFYISHCSQEQKLYFYGFFTLIEGFSTQFCYAEIEKWMEVYHPGSLAQQDSQNVGANVVRGAEAGTILCTFYISLFQNHKHKSRSVRSGYKFNNVSYKRLHTQLTYGGNFVWDMLSSYVVWKGGYSVVGSEKSILWVCWCYR